MKHFALWPEYLHQMWSVVVVGGGGGGGGSGGSGSGGGVAFLS